MDTKFKEGNEIGAETRFKAGNQVSSKYKSEYCEELLEFFKGKVVLDAPAAMRFIEGEVEQKLLRERRAKERNADHSAAEAADVRAFCRKNRSDGRNA